MIKRFGKFVARRKYIFIAVFCCIVVGLVAIIPSISTSTRPKGEYTIVIDAGHGGLDVKYRLLNFLYFFKKNCHIPKIGYMAFFICFPIFSKSLYTHLES